MNPIITSHLKAINQLCQQYKVAKLEVFGSASRSDFNVKTSDIDFLVEFTEHGIQNYADNYFGLLTALQELFDRPVELVVSSSIDNPYFIESIEQDRQYLYAA